VRVASIAGLFFAAVALAQTPARPAFEAAAIHLHPNCREQGGGRGNLSPGRVGLPCVSMRSVIRAAYGTFDTNGQMLARPINVIGGPAWLDSDTYDLDAKAEGAESLDQTVGRMLQALLEERSKLKVHREARETAVYAITVAKSGSKLKESAPDSCIPLDLSHPPLGRGTVPCGFPTMRGDGNTITVEAKGATIAQFAGRAMSQMDRPVVDKTGLTGRYDIHLEYSRESSVRMLLNGADAAGTLPPDAGGESIFSAAQSQLGLRLASDKAPIDVIVVDSVERPSEN
jgi:uncharacterized protein (TIGR03435 family)